MSDHVKGLLITALGVLFVSPDTLLIRLAGLDVWSLSVWRGVLQAIGLTFLLFCFYGRGTARAFMAIGTSGLLLAVIFAANNFAFLAAVLNTKTANALIILATAPFFAAVLSWFFLKERVALRTWLAILGALCGIAVIGWEGLGGGTLFGDAMALLAAFLLGLKLTLVRGSKAINMIPAIAVSSVLVAALAWPLARPAEVTEMQVFWVLLMGLAVMTPATALVTLGPRYLAAPEVGLLVLLETILGPLWVWMVIREEPGMLGIIGGGIVVTSLALHAVLSLQAQRRPAEA